MYTGLLHLHNLLRWVILILIVVAIFRHLTGMNQKRAVNAGDKKIDLFLMIAAHTTLVLGLVQWFVGDFGLNLIQRAGMKAVMANGALRFWAIEHITGMIIAIVLITIGRGKVKRAVDYTAHKKAFTFFLLALIIILASVPWPFREAVARPWFPGMHI
jgi:membrane protein CcdC involved in cytochrome C biogenesis